MSPGCAGTSRIASAGEGSRVTHPCHQTSSGCAARAPLCPAVSFEAGSRITGPAPCTFLGCRTPPMLQGVVLVPPSRGCLRCWGGGSASLRGRGGQGVALPGGVGRGHHGPGGRGVGSAAQTEPPGRAGRVQHRGQRRFSTAGSGSADPGPPVPRGRRIRDPRSCQIIPCPPSMSPGVSAGRCGKTPPPRAGVGVCGMQQRPGAGAVARLNGRRGLQRGPALG